MLGLWFVQLYGVDNYKETISLNSDVVYLQLLDKIIPWDSQKSAKGIRKSPIAFKINVRKQLKYVTDTLNQFLDTAEKINHMNVLSNMG